MEQVKVSIIIPVYNAEMYLQECLESICNQTLSEWEAICIEDCSEDASRAILERYHKKDTRISVICNEFNMGASISRNKGLELARGKYIQFVDADDYLEKTALEELYFAAEEQNAEMGYLKMQLHVGDNIQLTTLQQGIQETYPGHFRGTELMKIFVEQQEFFLYLCSAFYSNSFLKKHNLTYKSMNIGEGGNFILRALCEAKRVIVLDGIQYHYRIHEASITHGKNAKKELIYGQLNQYIDVLRYFSKNEETDGLREFLNVLYKKTIGGIQGLSNNDLEKIEERLNTQFEKQIYNMLRQNNGVYGISFNKELLDRIHKKEKVIIYGAGYASKEVIEQLHKHDIEIVGFAVTKRSGKRSIYGHHVYEIQELCEYCENAIVLVAANQKYNQEIEEILHSYNFMDIVFMNVVI